MKNLLFIFILTICSAPIHTLEAQAQTQESPARLKIPQDNFLGTPAPKKAKEEAGKEETQEKKPFISLTESIYQRLTPEEQELLIEESQKIFNYCTERDLFAKFHDCRCVAARFMDERLQNPDTSKGIIGIADRVAGDCPNLPGAAGYGYEQCNSQYSHRMSIGLEPFCICYAQKFAKFYKENPVAFMPNITRISTASLLACDKTGMSSPLHPNR